MDLIEPELHLTLAFSMLWHLRTLCTAEGIHSCPNADCIRMQFRPGRPLLRAAGYEFIAPFHYCVGPRICTFALLDSYGLEPDPFVSGLLVVLLGVVFGFGVWFGSAGRSCQAHSAYRPFEFVMVTCASRHT